MDSSPDDKGQHATFPRRSGSRLHFPRDLDPGSRWHGAYIHAPNPPGVTTLDGCIQLYVFMFRMKRQHSAKCRNGSLYICRNPETGSQHVGVYIL
jgi:hypothetical protein